MSRVKPTSPMKTTINPRNQKSVYIDLDSVVEQVHLKSSIVQQKIPEKKNDFFGSFKSSNVTVILSWFEYNTYHQYKEHKSPDN